MNSKHLFFRKTSLVLLLFMISFANAQNKISTKTYNKLKQARLEFENTPVLQGARHGISVRDMTTGNEIVAVNNEDNFAPASNLKLLYTLSAVDLFDKAFVYTTKLYKTGNLLANGILMGDLVFQPSGDPSFASQRMNESLDSIVDVIVNQIKATGIKEIKGNLVMELNGFRYPLCGSIPIEDVGNYYGTGAWDFNFNDNRIDVYVERSTEIGKPVKILYTKPEIPGITFISKVKTAAPDTDDQSYVFGAPYTMPRYILGTIPAGEDTFKIKAGIPNPPLSFLKLLQKKLNDLAIYVEDVQIKYTQKDYKNPIWEKNSKPLLYLAETTNDYSINHFSEAFAWLLIQGNKPADGYIDKEAIHDFFVPYGFEKADIEDGCGLAPDNLVQPAQMTDFLKIMTDRLGGNEVLSILPHAGVDGYAKYFLKDNPLQNQVWVKSGSVSKVQNYTGIFKAKSGKFYSFSVMTNMFIGKHKDVKTAIEKLLTAYIKNL